MFITFIKILSIPRKKKTKPHPWVVAYIPTFIIRYLNEMCLKRFILIICIGKECNYMRYETKYLKYFLLLLRKHS